MSRTFNFKSRKKYLRWLAWGHIRTKTGKVAKSIKQSVFATTPGRSKVKIRGKLIKVKHKR